MEQGVSNRRLGLRAAGNGDCVIWITRSVFNVDVWGVRFACSQVALRVGRVNARSWRGARGTRRSTRCTGSWQGGRWRHGLVDLGCGALVLA